MMLEALKNIYVRVRKISSYLPGTVAIQKVGNSNPERVKEVR